MSSRKRKSCDGSSEIPRKIPFPADRKKLLADSDLGSFYNQDQQWPGEFEKQPSTSATISASSKKLKNMSTERNRDQNTNKPGLTIVDGKQLDEELKNSVSCKYCGSSVELLEQTSSKQGLGSYWTIQCTKEDCAMRRSFPTSDKPGRFFQVNRSAVLGMRSIGRGHSSAEKLFSIMGLPPPINHNSWSEHSKVIEENAKELLVKELEEAAREVREKLQENLPLEQQKTTVDAGASFDGSWCTRGWSATDACVAAISVETGKVLDVIHMNRSCTDCKKMEDTRKKGESKKQQYLEWYLEHEPQCFLNHEGTSSAMEATGVVHLYNRSQERGLRYIPYIGDGDSKAYSDVCQAQPYGPALFIPKEECISHVTKRMVTALRSLTKEYKGKKMSDGKGLGGSGRLTVKRIDTIQNFYGRAIRDNKGNSKAMSKATHAILKHYSSTPEEPRHEDCPEGSSSWCSYQRDQANGTCLHKPIKNPLSPAIVEAVQPTFDRLGDETFLAGCENCMSQNPNESLHHLIWSIATKDMYNSPTEISIAISLGVLQFNRGFSYTYSQLMSKMGLEISTPMQLSWQRIDKERIVQNDYRNSVATKKRRKQKKKEKATKEDAFVHAEGTTYKSQAFHGSKPVKKKQSTKKRSNKEMKKKQKTSKKKRPSKK